jgi:predicted aldo/keto reductase-like oxidoreductase
MLVLSGMSNLEQTVDNVKTLTDFEPVNTEEQGIIDKALNVYLESKTIPCTSCNYCMPCPHGVEIPKNFANYNKFAISKNKNEFIHEYEHNMEFSNADFCISCGECVELCPQHIQIPERMIEISKLFIETKNK